MRQRPVVALDFRRRVGDIRRDLAAAGAGQRPKAQRSIRERAVGDMAGGFRRRECRHRLTPKAPFDGGREDGDGRRDASGSL
jgi:hypothetical protein